MSKRSPRGKASMLDAHAHIIYIDGKIGPNIPPQAPCSHFPVNIFAGYQVKHYICPVVRQTSPIHNHVYEQSENPRQPYAGW